MALCLDCTHTHITSNFCLVWHQNVIWFCIYFKMKFRQCNSIQWNIQSKWSTTTVCFTVSWQILSISWLRCRHKENDRSPEYFDENLRCIIATNIVKLCGALYDIALNWRYASHQPISWSLFLFLTVHGSLKCPYLFLSLS